MTAAAAVAAGVVSQIVRRRDTAQFERFGNVLLGGMLDFVKLLARIQKTALDGILEQGIAMLFKFRNAVWFSSRWWWIGARPFAGQVAEIDAPAPVG